MKLYGKMKLRLAKKILRFDPRDVTLPIVGNVYNDCDGFNHRLTKATYVQSSVCGFQNRKKGWFTNCPLYLKEDGHAFCGCTNIFLDEPSDPKDIQEEFSNAYKNVNIEDWRAAGWWTEETQRICDFIVRGGRVCDDLGMPSKEFLDAKKGV